MKLQPYVGEPDVARLIAQICGEKVELPVGLRDASPGTKWAYTALYSETGADYYDLFEALMDRIEQAVTVKPPI